MELNLTDEQQSLLVSILQDTLGEVREEVYKAELSTFRDEMRRKEELIRDLLVELGSASAAAG